VVRGADRRHNIPDTALMTVHPTMLYSAAALVTIFAILWALRRAGRAPGWLFGWYLLLAGTERFFVEFLRAKDDRFLWGFSTAQALAAGAVAAGLALLVLQQRRKAHQPTARSLHRLEQRW
jgi:phosphatidylglycerol:prolipoprotein diacylglycerol transferase